MRNVTLVKHSKGAPLLRLFGIGASFKPIRGILQLQQLFNQYTFWAENRNRKNIKKMLSNSASVVTLWNDNQLIGFGRATSDSIYRAVLWDIVVNKSFQGEGYGKLIIEELLSSKEIKRVEKVYLMTTNQEKFYKQFFFEEVLDQKLLLLNLNQYNNAELKL
tara:strand:+ start:302 stop:787 length:486 start_codon:yes stop_codon:yes gene_type:complete